MTTDLDAEIRLRLWRRRIGNLDIEDRLTIDGVTVYRRNHNVYTVNGRRVGGGNCTVFTAQLFAIELASGVAVSPICIKCRERPRLDGDSYCRICRNGYQRRYMQRRRKGIAA